MANGHSMTVTGQAQRVPATLARVTMTAAEWISEEVAPFLKRMAVNILEVEEQVKNIAIKSDADAEKATPIGTASKANLQALEAKRKEYVKPLNDIVDQINGMFKPESAKCELQGKTVNKAVQGYLTYKNEQAQIENRRRVDAAHRSENKAIAEYVVVALRAAREKKVIPSPAEQVKALLYGAPNIPSDADEKERGSIMAAFSQAREYMTKSIVQAQAGSAPAPVAKAKTEIVMAPVEVEPIKNIGTFTGREETVLTVVDAASIPREYLIDVQASLADDKRTAKLTKASNVILFSLDAGKVLREFTAGRQVPGLKVEKKLGGST